MLNRLEEDRRGSVHSVLSPLLLSHPEDEMSDYSLDSPRLVCNYVRQNMRMVRITLSNAVVQSVFFIPLASIFSCSSKKCSIV